MAQERRLARERGYADPVHADLAATAACFDACAGALLLPAVAGGRAHAMFATHNEGAVGAAERRMTALGVRPGPAGGASFAQLLGMADALSFGLASRGHAVHKYVPYGPVREVLPYLLRRAVENGDVLAGGGAARELGALRAELARRLRF